MEKRLLRLIETEGLNPAKFAEAIGVQRSSVSHMLSGRNKPSFDVLQQILTKFPRINAEWLLLGTGDMFKRPVQTSIFDSPAAKIENNPVKPMETRKTTSISQDIEPPKAVENAINKKEIDRVLIFYSDKTFTEYQPA